jgi:hypothetical protein
VRIRHDLGTHPGGGVCLERTPRLPEIMLNQRRESGMEITPDLSIFLIKFSGTPQGGVHRVP